MTRYFLIATAILTLTTPGATQIVPAYDLGGAKKPKPDMSFRKENQYKRVHQSSLRFILRGELDKTEEFLNGYLANHPTDEETLYMLGILHGQRNDIPKAESFFERAIAAGLPEDRLIAGPRKMMEPVADTPLMKRLMKKYSHRLVHGPLLGNVSDTSASIWLRTATECEVDVVAVIPNGTTADIRRSSKVKTNASEDYTAVAVLNDLKPNTMYQFTILLNEEPCEMVGSQTFWTFVPKGQSTDLKFAFGGGSGFVPQNERMWNTIGSFNPHAILLLGDNVYIDDPESVVMQQYTYQRRQSRPEWRKLTAGVPVFTIWDDHDFSTNDSWGGADIAVPFWKKDWVFPIFRQNWANPGYGGGDAQPGCWYSFSIADIDFIMLDCRYYRTDPRESPRSMLGPVQKKWLKEQLSSAKGTFKMLCSSVPWDYRTKGDSLDTWNGYKKERDEILDYIAQEKIEGVVLVSADRHRSDAWKIARPNAYDLYEFNSSRLTNQHVHPTMVKQGAIFSYNKLQSFGLVTFDTYLDDPEVTYDVININGEKVHSITVKRSQLKF